MPATFEVFLILAATQEITQRALVQRRAERNRPSGAVVSGALRELRELGLVAETIVDTADTRRRIVRLTEDGRRAARIIEDIDAGRVTELPDF